MEHPILPLLRPPQARILTLCEEHFEREEALLTDMAQSLRQVRDAFFQRNLNVLPTLQNHQSQIARTATEMIDARERLRTILADVLALPVEKATPRTAALSLPEPAQGLLLRRHSEVSKLVCEVEQLSQQNAALLGYARGFYACLFAGLTGSSLNEGYGPHGERRGGVYGSFLEARV